MRQNPLKQHIDQTGVSQRALAKAIGVREATVSDWASGKVIPSPPHMIRISEVTAGAVPPGAWFEHIATRSGPAA